MDCIKRGLGCKGRFLMGEGWGGDWGFGGGRMQIVSSDVAISNFRM